MPHRTLDNRQQTVDLNQVIGPALSSVPWMMVFFLITIIVLSVIRSCSHPDKGPNRTSALIVQPHRAVVLGTEQTLIHPGSRVRIPIPDGQDVTYHTLRPEDWARAYPDGYPENGPPLIFNSVATIKTTPALESHWVEFECVDQNRTDPILVQLVWTHHQ